MIIPRVTAEKKSRRGRRQRRQNAAMPYAISGKNLSRHCGCYLYRRVWSHVSWNRSDWLTIHTGALSAALTLHDGMSELSPSSSLGHDRHSVVESLLCDELGLVLAYNLSSILIYPFVLLSLRVSRRSAQQPLSLLLLSLHRRSPTIVCSLVLSLSCVFSRSCALPLNLLLSYAVAVESTSGKVLLR